MIIILELSENHNNWLQQWKSLSFFQETPQWFENGVYMFVGLKLWPAGFQCA